MMKQEFEELAGYEVTWEDYTKIIEPMYMATNLTKQEFVKTINKKRFALRPLKSIVKEMKELAEQIEDRCTIDGAHELKKRLNEVAKEYIARKYGGYAKPYFNEAMKWSCYYITSLEICDSEWKTIETINLI